jgi:cytochrome c peroxidase
MGRTTTLLIVVAAWAAAAGVSHGRVGQPSRAQGGVVTAPELTDADLDAGGVLYVSRCAGCHGAAGAGSTPADERTSVDLTRPALRTRTDQDIATAIVEGRPARGMPAFDTLSVDQRRHLVAWVRSLGGIRVRVRATDGGSGYAWELPPGFPQPKVPADNPMTAAKVDLGRHLFYDARLSRDGTFSCARCHEQRLAFSDGKARAIGVTGATHPRGAMSLGNVAYSPVLTWANPDQRRLELQAMVPLFGEHPIEMGLTGHEAPVLARLAAEPRYTALFAAAFPEDAAPFTVANITRAIASFERTLLSGRSPYDLYRTSADPRALSPAALRGEDLFFSERTRCFRCHGSFAFTETVDYVGKGRVDVTFHNTALYSLGAQGAYPAPNTGVHAVSGQAADMGRFKAPSLRNIALTAPYMHDGSIDTLADVIRHYEAGGRSANNPHKSALVKGFALTGEERADLVAFLESLTDLAFTSDPRHSNPWPQKGKELATALTASPAWAQSSLAPASDGRGARAEAVLDRALAPAPLQRAIDLEARRHAAELGQAASGRPSRAGSCVKRVFLFTLLGTAVSLAAAGILLASTGGSDDTNGILTKWGVAGAASGAVVGALSCAAP